MISRADVSFRVADDHPGEGAGRFLHEHLEHSERLGGTSLGHSLPQKDSTTSQTMIQTPIYIIYLTVTVQILDGDGQPRTLRCLSLPMEFPSNHALQVGP